METFRILVVDDNDPLWWLIRSHLKALGYDQIVGTQDVGLPRWRFENRKLSI